jgi:protein-S-isoprenylcysteine O-methyltransferase
VTDVLQTYGHHTPPTARLVSLLLLLLQSWRFFYERIQYEEWYLRKFFGADYTLYSERTHSGIPFIA